MSKKEVGLVFQKGVNVGLFHAKYRGSRGEIVSDDRASILVLAIRENSVVGRLDENVNPTSNQLRNVQTVVKVNAIYGANAPPLPLKKKMKEL